MCAPEGRRDLFWLFRHNAHYWRMCRASARTGKIISGSQLDINCLQQNHDQEKHCSAGLESPVEIPDFIHCPGSWRIQICPKRCCKKWSSQRHGSLNWLELPEGPVLHVYQHSQGFSKNLQFETEISHPRAELSQFPQTKNRWKKLRLSNTRFSGKKLNFPNRTIIS